jgi:hypothetical protein
LEKTVTKDSKCKTDTEPKKEEETKENVEAKWRSSPSFVNKLNSMIQSFLQSIREANLKD